MLNTLRMVFALALTGLVLVAADGAEADHPKPIPGPVVAKVYGCEAEDSCAIDYRADARGRGVWIIREQRP